MSGAVFDSYIKSVYGSGTSMEYFDNINGGDIYGDNNIFGGVNAVEILDEIDGFYSKSEKKERDTKDKHSDSDSDSDSVSDSDSDSDSDSKKCNTRKDSKKTKKDSKPVIGDTIDNQSIIGYITYNTHSIPIVDCGIEKNIKNVSIIAPMEIKIDQHTSKKTITPEDVGSIIRELDLKIAN